MKYTAGILLGLVAVSNAAHCNKGWGRPLGASCPSSYPNTYCVSLLETAKSPEVLRTFTLIIERAPTLQEIRRRSSNAAKVTAMYNAALEYLFSIC
ncbi:hypothetical protein CSHISOI_04176 [Colletotrichum shisoi]|uniref:Uncharacterized protein n=1 Tax=Colletotrichum shisoi TaxID=2078593 RepID=A0A5Q4BW60_9PEZI|nr:hypothetical protein CSHISOI_04176 [Colletotrichum shisoi]